MSKISIVARRRGCQLATTVPVLLFTWAIALCYELLTMLSPFMQSVSLELSFYQASETIGSPSQMALTWKSTCEEEGNPRVWFGVTWCKNTSTHGENVR